MNKITLATLVVILLNIKSMADEVYMVNFTKIQQLNMMDWLVLSKLFVVTTL